MEMRSLLDAVRRSGAASDERTAGSICKAVLGILASSVDEADGREIVDCLPPELDYDTLRGHQVRTNPVSLDQCAAIVANQFGLSADQAHDMVHDVLQEAFSGMGEDARERCLSKLPADWQSVSATA